MAEARWLRFLWTPERQEIAVDGEVFAHPQATGTAASHDVAHLLAAAAGLPWRPRGTRADVCFAEFNAVLLEHLGVNVFDAVVLGRGANALARTLEHSRWFVETHYAPFPVSFDEALSRLRRLDAVAAVRLSPVLFRTRAFELAHTNFRERTVAARFSSAFVPGADVLAQEPQRELARELEALIGAA